MSEIIIREAGLNELDRIAPLKKQIHDVHVQGRPDLFNPIADMAAFAQNAAGKGCSLLLAECENAVVGHLLREEVSHTIRTPRPKCMKYLPAARAAKVRAFASGAPFPRFSCATTREASCAKLFSATGRRTQRWMRAACKGQG